jgi:hypothetical protein
MQTTLPVPDDLPLLTDAQAKDELAPHTALWSQMRDERIRKQNDQLRLTQEVSDARADAEANYGTSNVDEMRARVRDIRSENSRNIWVFAETVNLIVQRLEETRSRLSA